MFELHLTSCDVVPAAIVRFSGVCEALGCKLLLVELARGQHCLQPMATAHTDESIKDLIAAQRYAADLTQELDAHGFAIDRIKIESTLAHREARVAIYFEWHCKVLLHDTDAVLSLCERHGAHLSRNAQRGGSLARFITLRQTNSGVDSRSLFEARVRLLLAAACVLSSICTPLKQQFEACLFDSNVAIDAGWLEKL